MKKKTKLMMTLLLAFTIFITSIDTVKANEGSGGSGTGGRQGGGGGGTSSYGCERGATGPKCTLSNAAGMRISVVMEKKDGTKKTLCSRNYLQPGYGSEPYNRTFVGEGHTVKMAGGAKSGAATDYDQGKGVSWKSCEGTGSSRGYNMDSCGNAQVSELDGEWSGYIDMGMQGHQTGGYNFNIISYIQGKVTDNLWNAMDDGKSLKSTTFYKLATSTGSVNIGGKSIDGLGCDPKKFKQAECEDARIYMVYEPMMTMRGGGGDYLGTCRELADRAGGWARNDSSNRHTYEAACASVHTTQNHFSQNGVELDSAFNKPSRRDINNPEWSDMTDGSGMGVNESIYGRDADACVSNTPKPNYVPLCWTKKNVVSNQPFCGGLSSRTVFLSQIFTQVPCNELPASERHHSQREIHASGILVGGTVEKNGNYCGVYCADNAQIIYPPNLDDTILLNPATSKIANGTATWLELGGHELKVSVNRRCQIDVDNGFSDKIEDQVSASDCQDTFDAIPSISGTPATSFTYDYTEAIYGTTIPVNQYNVRLDGGPGSVSYYTEYAFTTNPAQTYSIFNTHTNRYEIPSGGIRSFDKYYDVPQLAFSEKSLNTASSDGTGSSSHTSLNIDTFLIGFSGNYLSDKEKGETPINLYECIPSVELGRCERCISRSMKKNVNVCCMGPTGAQAYDTFCENGYLKPEYDGGSGSINASTMENACTCKSASGTKFNMFDDSSLVRGNEQSCMSKYYENHKGKDTVTLWKEAYNYCLKIFQSPGGSCSGSVPETKPKCPVTSPRNAGKEIPNGETEASWCNSTIPKCPSDAPMHAGSQIPNGETEETWCYNAEYCPSDADIHAGELIPEGKTYYNWCFDNKPRCSTTATLHPGEVIPDGESVDSWCTLKKCPPDASDHAGQVIPEGESVDTWCTCATCYEACVCPATSYFKYSYITSIATRLLAENKATDFKAACKIAKRTSCGDNSGNTAGGGTTESSENYVYHPIDLNTPFLESSLSTANTLDSEIRAPGSNWISAIDKNNQGVLTTKYITSKADLYKTDGSGNSRYKPLYVIDLTPRDTVVVRAYNRRNDYNDFTLYCDTYTDLCKSTFLGRVVPVNGSMANLSIQNLQKEINKNKEGKR